MSGKVASYLTGANARIKVFGKTMAYATDVSYTASVQTIAIETMGKYESHDNSPVGYVVEGTFSIVRYTLKLGVNELRGDRSPTLSNAAANIGSSPMSMGDHFNPSKILASQTFDLDIFQRNSNGAGTAGAQGVAGAIGTSETWIMTVEDCRMTRKGMTLNKRGVWVETMSFVGIMAKDQDVATADVNGSSGVGEDLK